MERKKDKKLGENLALDELFDLTLYKKMLDFAGPVGKEILNKLIPVETAHLRAWQNFFGIPSVELGFGRKVKLFILLILGRVFGEGGVHLILQAIEIHGIKKYLAAWESYKNEPLGLEIKNILRDEFEHEDEIVSSAKGMKIYPERVRDIFLGFNDGLVEILGAVSGFFAAFNSNVSVLIAALTVAVAGSISMAASVFAAQSSEKEVKNMEIGKKRFLGKETPDIEHASTLRSATIVGIFYFIGSLVPVLPVVFGATNPLYSIIVAGIIIITLSYIVAFLSGMDARKRIATNLIIIAVAVTVTYSLATFAKSLFGIAI